jgi:hypothetical protein
MTIPLFITIIPSTGSGELLRCTGLIIPKKGDLDSDPSHDLKEFSFVGFGM